LEGGDELMLKQATALEASEQRRIGRGTAWGTVATYVEAGADPDALLLAHLDYDRIGEWTGHPVAKVLQRDAGSMLVQCDGVRKFGPLELGAKWQFKAKILRRGHVRVVATQKTPSA